MKPLTDTQKTNLEALCKELETTTKPQGTHCLKDKDGKYCCLGIGAEKMGNTLVEEKGREGDSLFDGCVCELPPKAQEYYGLDDLGRIPGHVAVILEGRPARSLAALNDMGMPFPQIAKVIRKHWLGQHP